MNENPVGTPNPLNPVPQPAAPQPAPGMQPVTQPGMQPETSAPTMPVAEQTVTQPMPAMSGQSTTMEQWQSTPQAAEQMPQPEPELVARDSVVESKKKGRAGIIIGTILGLVAVGCIVAVVLVFTVFKPADAVPAAMSKLMSGDIPSNVVLNGRVTVIPDIPLAASDTSAYGTGLSEITAQATESLPVGMESLPATIEINGTTMPISAESALPQSIEIDFNSEIITNSGSNYTTAEVTLISQEDKVEKYNVSEVKVADGDVFIRVEGLSGAYASLSDEWLRVPISSKYLEESNMISGMVPTNLPTQCLIDAAGKLGEYGNDFKAKYEANPFISYSTDNIPVAKKTNTIYRLTYDVNKLTAFINSMSNSGFANELNACMGTTATNTPMTVEGLSQIANYLPAMYAEIDSENKFTRIYLNQEYPMIGSVSVDIDISYPKTLAIEEPDEYVELDKAVESITQQVFPAEGITVEITTGEATNEAGTTGE